MGLLDDLRASRRRAGRRWLPTAAEALPDDTEPALLFIPDISGFTRFIEASGHPQAPHLVADLLEILVEANISDLRVAEIQGDAVLFYRLGPPPSAQQLVEQCRRIFLDFQNYLRLVARDGGSELSTALLDSGGLTLKIVAHYGRVSVAQIREFTRLLGRDVIVAHRLLKNQVPGSEYVLLTEGYLATQDPAELTRCFSWTRLQDGADEYEYIGQVRYRYAYLTPLRLLLDEAFPAIAPEALARRCALKARRALPVPAAYALRLLSNYRLRPRWMAGVTAVHYDVTKAARPGTSYKLDLYSGQIDLQAVQSIEAEDHLEYVEKVSHFRLFPNALLFFYIEEVDARNCLVTAEFRYGHIASASRLIRRGQLRRVRRWLGSSLQQLAALSVVAQPS
ncbi:DUF2652 domain-containing protein [Hymenobacter busanensis]|uniref:DUF2652 domain-containing protein n=1 Tax=Hymenobacter busanensis TaxID=2607656 RepID=A0A7L4ZYG5_9BACT|nr:DUF2652 domain-containing protein [Hymenobacter busanensis]KAA9333432.1 DUF2652 domain-containing protein [Hymenobacter busanensis]QHJ07885.1 DUF2652 domain-containing protein [Hymenobacter busanensis]